MRQRQSDSSLIAERIGSLRKRLGLKQEDFAARLGVDQTTVSKWERGKARPTPDAFVRLASAADDFEKLFFLEHAGLPKEYILGEPMVPELQNASHKLVSRVLGTAYSGPETKGSVETEILVSAIIRTQREMKRRNISLPLQKYARAVAILYQVRCVTGKWDFSELEREFKMAS